MAAGAPARWLAEQALVAASTTTLPGNGTAAVAPLLPGKGAGFLLATTTAAGLAALTSSVLAPTAPPAAPSEDWEEEEEEEEELSFSKDAATPAPPPCQLLATSFGWWLQVFLAAVCFVSLVGKRFTDSVRRPWKVWFFDTSKQGLSACMVHFVNILLSMAFGRWLGASADPCNWYWINLTLDDTLGIGVQFLLLRLLQFCYRLKCVGRPELALTGEYGDPPSYRIFMRQLLDWQGLVCIQKFALASMVVNFTQEVAVVAGVCLGWLDPYPRVKLVVVMVLTPIVMNVFALWVADSFLQADPVALGEAKRSLVATDSPSVLGQPTGASPPSASRTSGRRKRGGAREPASLAEELSGEDCERVVSFQEWKQRGSKSKPSGPSPMRIPPGPRPAAEACTPG